MKRADLSPDYARALYDLALEEWAGWLQTVRQRLAENEPLTRLLAEPGLSPAEKFRRLEAVLPADASPKFRQFLALLADKGQLSLLSEITSAFERLAARGPAAQVAVVTSAVELTPAERAKLEAGLRRRFGAGLEFEYALDPALYGGVRVRVGDTVIDGSLAGQLETLRAQLSVRR